jgi:RNA polymerase sigma-70 factor (ECF subfamily)
LASTHYREEVPLETALRDTIEAVEFTSLYRAYRPRLFQICLRILKDPLEAEDTCQEVFIKAIRAWDAFEGRSKLGTWITSICLNECRTRLRMRKYRARQLSSYLLEAETCSSHPSADIVRLRTVLEREKPKMKPVLRKILRMHLEDGLNHREIAENLRVSRVYVTRLMGHIKWIVAGKRSAAFKFGKSA